MPELAYQSQEHDDDSALFTAIEKLVVLETLVAHAYGAVDDMFEDGETREQLRAFRREHERNARALTGCLCRACLERIAEKPAFLAADSRG